MRSYVAAFALIVAGVPALGAERAALLIGNSDYRQIEDVRQGDRALRPSTELKRSGFTVVSLRNATAETLRRAIESYIEQADGSGRAVILLGGHFINTGSTTWYLPVDTEDLTVSDLIRRAIPVSILLDLAADIPGGAVVALGGDTDAGENLEDALTLPLRAGMGQIEVPQGVTLITGEIGEVSDFIEDDLLNADVDMRNAVSQSRHTVRMRGYLPAEPFLTRAARDRPAPRVPARRAPENRAPENQAPVNQAPTRNSDDSFWDATTSIDTERAYGAYLERFPRGNHAAQARKRLDEIKDAPRRRAEEAEAALQLNRAARRAVQNHLTILGYDTRGIDGIFGKGTRAAVTRWQGDNGYDRTGYLNRAQVVRLSEQGEARASELAAEARLKEERMRQQDTAYWRQTGREGTEAGLRAYLKRYPDGQYADTAEAQLADIEARRRQAAAEEERRFWDDIRAQDTVEAYRAYMRDYPRGAFQAEAEGRIAELQRESSQSGAIEQAKQDEAQLTLLPVTLVLVEQRLRNLGFDPGETDGRLTKQSRRAIRRYQETRNLDVTGYLSRQTLVRLIADQG